MMRSSRSSWTNVTRTSVRTHPMMATTTATAATTVYCDDSFHRRRHSYHSTTLSSWRATLIQQDALDMKDTFLRRHCT